MQPKHQTTHHHLNNLSIYQLFNQPTVNPASQQPIQFMPTNPPASHSLINNPVISYSNDSSLPRNPATLPQTVQATQYNNPSPSNTTTHQPLIPITPENQNLPTYTNLATYPSIYHFINQYIHPIIHQFTNHCNQPTKPPSRLKLPTPQPTNPPIHQ